MLRTGFLAFALLFFPFVAAHGEATQEPESQQSGSHFLATQPDLLSFGAGYVDFDKFNNKFSQDGAAHSRATDGRLEYRFGYALWATQNDWFDFGIHPLAGGEASSHKQFYGFGGLDFDWLLWKHVVITESETVGLFDSGNAKPLGSYIEFRSQLESGWRFNNNIRATAFIGHISNAGLTHRNPGEEIVGGYIHIPVGLLFGG